MRWVCCAFVGPADDNDYEELKQGADEAVEQADPLIAKGTVGVSTVRALIVLCL